MKNSTVGIRSNEESGLASEAVAHREGLATAGIRSAFNRLYQDSSVFFHRYCAINVLDKSLEQNFAWELDAGPCFKSPNGQRLSRLICLCFPQSVHVNAGTVRDIRPRSVLPHMLSISFHSLRYSWTLFIVVNGLVQESRVMNSQGNRRSPSQNISRLLRNPKDYYSVLRNHQPTFRIFGWHFFRRVAGDFEPPRPQNWKVIAFIVCTTAYISIAGSANTTHIMQPVTSTSRPHSCLPKTRPSVPCLNPRPLNCRSTKLRATSPILVPSSSFPDIKTKITSLSFLPSEL